MKLSRFFSGAPAIEDALHKGFEKSIQRALYKGMNIGVEAAVKLALAHLRRPDTAPGYKIACREIAASIRDLTFDADQPEGNEVEDVALGEG